MNRKDKQSKFGSEMQEAMRETTDFVQSILDHSCSASADVLRGASQIGIVANEFAHNVGDEDPLRHESNDVSKSLAQLIGRELQDKSPLAVANALFWVAARAATIAADGCPECEEEEKFAKATTVH